MPATGNYVKMAASSIASSGAGAVTCAPIAGIAAIEHLIASGGIWAAGTYQVSYSLVDTVNGQMEAGIGSYVTSTGVLTRTLPQHTFTGTTYDATGPSALTFNQATTFVYIAPLANISPLSIPGFANNAGGLGASTAHGIFPLNLSRTSAGTFAVTIDREYYAPILWPGGSQIDQLSTRSSTATTGNMKHAWYELKHDGTPGSKIKDFGAVAVGGSGVNSALAVSNFNPPAGWYAAGFIFDAAVSIWGLRLALWSTPFGADSTGVPIAGYTRSGSYATGLPDPAATSSPTAVTSALATDLSLPLCSYRMAA
jgi:hypothetical protein